MKCKYCAELCTVLKPEYFGKQVTNTLKVLKCGAGEGRERSVSPTV